MPHLGSFEKSRPLMSAKENPTKFKEVTKMINKEAQEMMINYLQSMMNKFKHDEARYGMDRHTEHLLDAMIACKEMAEALIGEPVNLRKDGKVTIGF